MSANEARIPTPVKTSTVAVTAVESLLPMDSLTARNGGRRSRTEKPLTAARRLLGRYGLLAILGGIPLQLGILSFLGYLWTVSQQSGRDEGEPRVQVVWRTIVLHSWMAPAITLSSVLIRGVVGTQLILCTALTAGLLLERGSVPFEDAPRLAVVRAYNSGPWDVVRLLLARHPTRLFRSLPGFLVTLLLLVGTALQFTSTLLVSDLGDDRVPSDPDTEAVAFSDSVGTFVTANSDYLWTKSLGTWPTYAEARSGNGGLGAEVSDTGTILRAFLPFDSRERLALRSYDGIAVLQQARTICIPATLENAGFVPFGPTRRLALEGTLNTPRDVFHQNGFSSSRLSRETALGFHCPFIQTDSRVRSPGVRGDSLELAICGVDGVGFQQFVLISAVGSYESWLEDGASLRRTSNMNGWATYVPDKAEGEQKGLRLTVSLCGLDSQHSLSNVSASTAGEPEELSLKWGVATESWNTDRILRHLGVTDAAVDPSRRGLLRLNRHLVSLVPAVPTTDATTQAMDAAFFAGLVTPHEDATVLNRSLLFCTRCSGFSNNDTVHPAHVLLVQAALNATNDPAAALDALWVSWSHSMYTGAVGQLDFAGGVNATMVWAAAVLVPRRWVGFLATAALLIAHIGAMLVLVFHFARRTGHSFCGGVWHAIAQVVAGEEMREVLEESTGLTDEETEELIRDRGLKGVYVGMQTDFGTGRVEMVRGSWAWKAGG